MIDQLNERVTFQKATVQVDSIGNHRNTWEDWFTCSAYASTYEAQEKEGEVVTEQLTVTFTVRWCTKTKVLTSTGYRVKFRDRIYNIISVDPMNYQKKSLKIRCALEEWEK